VEIARSLWDETALIADLDVEYVNFDRPAEAFLNPGRAFALQAPVQQAIAQLLEGYGIQPLHLLSGRGHHFIWQIDRKTPAFQRLTNLGRGPASLWKTTARQKSPDGKVVSPKLARAFAGLGQVMEFLAARVQEIAARVSQIPVELTAVEVGPSGCGREMISLDISEYGDPLPTRILRVPFSIYLKPWQQRGLIADEVLDKIEPLFVIPRGDLKMSEALSIMRSPEAAAQLAASAATRIPDASREMERLLDDYETSSLGKFHADFYAQEPEPPARWPATWPGCGRFIVEQPNDLLLRPACIRKVVRILLALGWHPRHIAGFIRSKYERDFGWTQFTDYDPAARADFYVRIFAGLFATGRDDLVDFNCTSAQEQGICFLTDCHDNLLRFREAALYRREHDQLAHRPFNRLLLPAEHS
jgi:hypothetical protein